MGDFRTEDICPDTSARVVLALKEVGREDPGNRMFWRRENERERACSGGFDCSVSRVAEGDGGGDVADWIGRGGRGEISTWVEEGEEAIDEGSGIMLIICGSDLQKRKGTV